MIAQTQAQAGANGIASRIGGHKRAQIEEGIGQRQGNKNNNPHNPVGLPSFPGEIQCLKQKERSHIGSLLHAHDAQVENHCPAQGCRGFPCQV